MLGTKAVHVPYNGSATSIASVISGETHFIMDTPISAKPQVAAGKVRRLASGTATRTPSMPDVPPIAESGLPGYEVTGYFAIVAPPKTPHDVVTRLNKEIVALMDDPEVSAKVQALGLEEDVDTGSGRRRTQVGLARWTKLAQDLKLQK